MDELHPIDLALHRAKVQVHRLLRWADDRSDPVVPARAGRLLVDLPLASEDRSPLWKVDLDPRELELELGKVENLRVAARALDGLEFEARQVFSFWAQVGPPLRVRGFVVGRELREGCVVPGVGGGLCLLSNALYGAAARAGFELLERHPHSRRPPGSRAALGEDATVAWNYVDLRFAAAQPWRLEVHLDAEALIVGIRSGIRSEGRRRSVGVVHERRSPEARADEREAKLGRARRRSGARSSAWSGEVGPSCMSCDQPCEYARPPGTSITRGRRSWLVDGVWPEYAAYLKAHARPEDQLLMPIDGELLRRPRYAWPGARVGRRKQFPALTLARSLRSRQLASQGAARQRALLEHERRLAAAMAAALEPVDTELVVAQTLVPHLWRAGALGGRRVEVLMQRLPLSELQAQLDEAHARNPGSPTLADFRADPVLVEAEAEALDAAAQILSPHASVAECFPDKARKLDWSRPKPGRKRRAPRAPGPPRLLLPSATVARKGAGELREALAGGERAQLWIAGRELEGPGFWSASEAAGVRVVHGQSPELSEVDALVLPAWVEHQPRALLRAVAAGVPVIASGACGLAGVEGVRTVAAGDVEDLRGALDELRCALDSDSSEWPGHRFVRESGS
ncbi:Vancomycin B-type resistance protein VanW [Enhygromyxa salina]|uniref:Vancomycin B-type resistance protein VanW n=1 Tax=Enhygromyxa salina TaxID=215803 RepID=A0A2S9XBV5_9BACT|nr:VanW family protein [Enhygromyxa salina]PRP90337.1 Vancomycin B-type resistance protein VanW [Enhygromyxa salina]